MRIKSAILSSRVFRFLNNHFDRTALIAAGAVVLISWAKYNSERYACIDGSCVEVVDGIYFSRAECHRSCGTEDTGYCDGNEEGKSW